MIKKILFLAAIIFLLSGCSLPSIKPSNKTEGSGTGEEVSLVKDARLRKFAEAFGKVESYKVTTTDENGNKVSAMAFQKPDKFHVTTETAKGTGEMITTSEATYIKNPENDSWLKIGNTPGESEEVKKMAFDTQKLEKPREGEEPKYLGEEPCGSLTCHVYEFSDGQSFSKVLFDTKDYLLRKMESTSGNQGKTVMEYAYEVVNIAAPTTGVEEFEMPKIEEGQMPSQEDLEKLKKQFGN